MVIIAKSRSSLLFFTGIVDVGETRKSAGKSPLVYLACEQALLRERGGGGEGGGKRSRSFCPPLPQFYCYFQAWSGGSLRTSR